MMMLEANDDIIIRFGEDLTWSYVHGTSFLVHTCTGRYTTCVSSLRTGFVGGIY
jgi:hypothetical protein